MILCGEQSSLMRRVFQHPVRQKPICREVRDMQGSSITLEEYPLEEGIRIFRKAGFNSIEMWKPQLKRCKTDQLRRAFAAYASGLGISMGGLNIIGEEYFQPFGTDQSMERTMDGLKADAEFALSLGTRDLLIWEGVAPHGTSEGKIMSQLLPRLTELFRAVIGALKPRGIRLLVEPHPFTVGMNDRFLIELCDSLDPAYFGVTYDFCHYGVGRPKDYITAIHALGHRIQHIHFSDTDQRISELHFPPGSGRLNLWGMLEAFRHVGYQGSMALDLYGYPMPVQALRAAAARMREACEFLGLHC